MRQNRLVILDQKDKEGVRRRCNKEGVISSMTYKGTGVFCG